MNVENLINPTSFGVIDGRDDDKPFVMVNLLKFKRNADYPDGSDSTLSGNEAYQRYLNAIVGDLNNLGGKIVVNNDVFGLLIGEVEELWDRVLLVKYPSKSAFKKFLSSDTVTDAGVHRKAGLAGQLNIATGEI